ncbi:MAG: hypothetical protein D6776_06385, partial [Planctomycetota bacterium]
METSGDNVLQAEEIRAWFDRMAPRLLMGLEVRVDGKPAAFRIVERRPMPPLEGLHLYETNGAFDTWWTFESSQPFGPGMHTIEVHDNNFTGEISESLMWLPQPLGTTFRTYAWEPLPPGSRQEKRGTEVVMFCRGMRIYFEFAPWVYEALAQRRAIPTATADVARGMRATAEQALARLGRTSAATATATVAATATAQPGALSSSPVAPTAMAQRSAERPGQQAQRETGALLSLRDRAFPIAILLALLWGAMHALAPGHGKSMVAAYLLGSDGKVRDALWLGFSVTISHVGSIFIAFVAVFGFVRLIGINRDTASGLVQFGLQLVAGLLVVA